MKRLFLALIITCTTCASFAQADSSGARKNEDPDKVFTKVDYPAEFPGGLDGWRQFLEKNLQYPKKALKKSIQGQVRVQFIVGKDGKISEAQALNDPGGGLAEEAVRIIKISPNWKPAEQNGRKVIYRHIQSITFRLE